MLFSQRGTSPPLYPPARGRIPLQPLYEAGLRSQLPPRSVLDGAHRAPGPPSHPPRACSALAYCKGVPKGDSVSAAASVGDGRSPLATIAPSLREVPPKAAEGVSFLEIPTPCPLPRATPCEEGTALAREGGNSFFFPKGAYGPLGNPPFLRGQPPCRTEPREAALKNRG